MGGGRALASFVVVASLWATPARADDRDKAAELTRKATNHFRLNEFNDALEDYTEAYRLIPEPSLLYDIGQCYRQLSRKEDAVRLFKSYLHEAPAAENRAEVQHFIETLETAIKDENAAKNLQAPRPISTPVKERQLTAKTSSAVEQHARAPVYKRWWFWTVIGGVAAGAAIGVAVGVTQSQSPTFNASLGTVGPNALTVSF